MTQFKTAWLERQRQRFMRPDANRYLRPDAFRRVLPNVVSSSPFKLNDGNCAPALVRKFDPDQPRVPAGSPDGGQWTSTAESEFILAARRISEALEQECWAQYMKDKFICSAFQSAACYNQAALRYANCLRGLPIPPLNF